MSTSTTDFQTNSQSVFLSFLVSCFFFSFGFALHVRNVLGTLGLLGIDGEQVLSARLLPIGKRSRLERSDANLAKVLLLTALLLLHLFPLSL